MSEKRCCRKCGTWTARVTDSLGRVRGKGGICAWEPDLPDVLAACFEGCDRARLRVSIQKTGGMLLYQRYIDSDAGADCPFWTPRGR